MRSKLFILGLWIAVGICVWLITPAGGACGTGITKNHLDSATGAFVDGDTLEIDSTNGVRIRPAYINGKVGTGSVSPSTYAGEQSVTLPNGLILKFGKTTNPSGDVPGGRVTESVTFDSAFSNATVSVSVTSVENATGQRPTIVYAVTSVTSSGFTIAYGEDAGVYQNCGGFYWMAVGY